MGVIWLLVNRITMKWCLHLNMPIRNMMLKILTIYYGQYRNYHYLSMNFERYSTLVLLLATLPADCWPLNVHPTHPYRTHYNKSDRLPIQCKLATLPANCWPLNVHPTHPYRTHYNKSDPLRFNVNSPPYLPTAGLSTFILPILIVPTTTSLIDYQSNVNSPPYLPTAGLSTFILPILIVSTTTSLIHYDSM